MFINPKDCIHYAICKFANDPGCLDGCDFRKESNTADNSEYMVALNVIEEYKKVTPEKVRSCLGVECFVKQRLNQQS